MVRGMALGKLRERMASVDFRRVWHGGRFDDELLIILISLIWESRGELGSARMLEGRSCKIDGLCIIVNINSEV